MIYINTPTQSTGTSNKVIIWDKFQKRNGMGRSGEF